VLRQSSYNYINDLLKY